MTLADLIPSKVDEASPVPMSRLWPPSAVTIMALCAGLTGLVLAADGRIETAIVCVLTAALLDACDGRVARMTGGVSRFGAELDSLSDVVCFGAVPAFILYQWGLSYYGSWGWLPCLALASACALRLARFNVSAAEPGRPVWAANYFTGVPAPGGAFLAMAPIYAELAGYAVNGVAAAAALVSVPAVAFLMVSRLPTFSGKSLGRKLPRIMLVPPLLLAALAMASLAAWPWQTLFAAALGYAATFPLSRWRHNLLSRRRLAQ
jgi:CDP-diacylglycerol---serine O-phosphatidyltransferase